VKVVEEFGRVPDEDDDLPDIPDELVVYLEKLFRPRTFTIPFDPQTVAYQSGQLSVVNTLRSIQKRKLADKE
jgi:hypothetical protein